MISVLFSDSKCLRPRLKPGEHVRVIKFSFDSMTLQLPPIMRESACRNVSVATVEYTIYYGVVHNGSANCTMNLKSCSQVVSNSNFAILE